MEADSPSSTSIPATIVVDSSVLTTAVAEASVDTTLETNMTTVPSDVSIGEPAGVPGAFVVAVCSLDAGDDNVWGTTDDVYDAPVWAITGYDGTYELALVGEACWATVAPPELLTDEEGGEVVLSAVDVSGASTSAERVVLQRAEADVSVPTTNAIELPTDGETTSLKLLDASGRSVGSVKGDVATGFRFATVEGSALPTPVASQLASASTQQRSTLSFFVLAIAALLALSILLGLARPRLAPVQALHVA